MSSALQIAVAASLAGFYTKESVGAVSDTLSVKPVINFSTGAGQFEADAVYTEAINIASEGSANRVLSALTDPLGQSINLLRVKAILITADASNTNDLVLAPGGSNPFNGPGGTSSYMTVKPGGFAVWACPGATGFPVAAGDNDTIQLVNDGSGSAVTGTLVIVGATE